MEFYLSQLSFSVCSPAFFSYILLVFLQLLNNSLRIVTENQKQGGAEFEGEYECVVSNGYSEDRGKALLILPEAPPPIQINSGIYRIIIIKSNYNIFMKILINYNYEYNNLKYLII